MKHSNIIPEQEKNVLKLEIIQRTATKMVPDLEEEEERLKKMLDTTKRKKRKETITIHKLKNNREETDRNDLIM